LTSSGKAAAVVVTAAVVAAVVTEPVVVAATVVVAAVVVAAVVAARVVVAGTVVAVRSPQAASNRVNNNSRVSQSGKRFLNVSLNCFSSFQGQLPLAIKHPGLIALRKRVNYPVLVHRSFRELKNPAKRCAGLPGKGYGQVLEPVPI
jgi:hypothetical protein